MPAPSVGRIVHYVSHGTPVRGDGSQAYACQCRAAIITDVKPAPAPDGAAVPVEGAYDVSLCVLNPTGMFFNEHVPYDQWDQAEALVGAQPQGGSWHWPERVE